MSAYCITQTRVPIGITTVNKQARIVMQLDHQVKPPGHVWVVAQRHKLIASVHALMEVKSGYTGDCPAVSYSWPTFMAITYKGVQNIVQATRRHMHMNLID